MTLKKYCVVLGLTVALSLTGCQSNSGTPENVENPSEGTAVEESHEEEDANDNHENEEVDFSEGFKLPEKALDVYMEEIVHKDYEIAYEALHPMDKEAFSVEDFVAYQKAFQSAKDIHGYAVHDEQSYKMFEFGGLQFEEVVFYDVDYAYVNVGEEPPTKEEDEDHGHDHSSDFTTHDHGHNMGTMGVAAVKRNGNWFILQGLSKYEMQDLTRKYSNQGISLNLDEKEVYVLGDAVSVGNLIFTINDISMNDTGDAYVLDVMLMNAGFDPVDTSHFVNKFAVKDSNTSNFMSVKSEGPNGLGGFVRAGSYTAGELMIPVKGNFEADVVYFLMNTIDPSKPPVRIDMNEKVESQAKTLYKQMQRKPSYKIGQLAELDVLSLEIMGTTEKASEIEGYNLLSIDVQLENTSDEKLYMNQLDFTVRSMDGRAVGIANQLQTETLEPGQKARETVQALIKKDIEVEFTLHLNSQLPNNNVTVDLQ